MSDEDSQLMNLRIPASEIKSKNRDVLYNFSLFTQSQVQTLDLLKLDIWDLLDKGMYINDGSNTRHGSYFNKASGLFWLWVLGAFEIIRTMGAEKSCFNSETNLKISNFKKKLAKIRSPFAKQKLTDGKTPVHFENCPYGHDFETKDYCYLIDDQEIWVKKIIAEFCDTIDSICNTDITDNYEYFLRKKHSLPIATYMPTRKLDKGTAGDKK